MNAVTVSFEVDLRKHVLDSHRREYDELSEIWNQIDTKAQGTITASGIFIGGILAYSRVSGQPFSLAERTQLAFAIVSLIVSVILSLLVLWPRTSGLPPSGTDIADLVEDVVGSPIEGRPDPSPGLYHDEAQLWKAAILDCHARNRQKVICLAAAQGMLVFAILLVATIAIRAL